MQNVFLILLHYLAQDDLKFSLLPLFACKSYFLPAFLLFRCSFFIPQWTSQYPEREPVQANGLVRKRKTSFTAPFSNFKISPFVNIDFQIFINSCILKFSHSQIFKLFLPWAMLTAALAAVTPAPVVLFGKHHKALRVDIEIPFL